jgi:hypothetical protein
MTEPLRLGPGALGGLVVASSVAPRRVHTCTRCEHLADTARRGGYAVPPVAEAESYVRFGIVYWAGLCRPCTDFEAAKRDAVAANASKGGRAA